MILKIKNTILPLLKKYKIKIIFISLISFYFFIGYINNSFKIFLIFFLLFFSLVFLFKFAFCNNDNEVDIIIEENIISNKINYDFNKKYEENNNFLLKKLEIDRKICKLLKNIKIINNIITNTNLNEKLNWFIYIKEKMLDIWKLLKKEITKLEKIKSINESNIIEYNLEIYKKNFDEFKIKYKNIKCKIDEVNQMIKIETFNFNEISDIDLKNKLNLIEINDCICLEKNEIKKNYILLNCNHYFHKNCIKNWFKNKLNCPLCKKNLE